MECFLLGTGGMMPMPQRLLTSLAVRSKGRLYLFDAGEGTQLGFKKLHLGLRGFDVAAVTHLHADHCLGLPGLLMLRAQMDDPAPFTLLGPPGLERFVALIGETLEFYMNFTIDYREWSPGASPLAYEDEHVRILWRPLKHTRFCLGYRLEERERPGKFRPEAAEALGVPKGPLWRELQRGNAVPLPSGGEVRPDQVLGPPRRGRCLSFVVDTRPVKEAVELCRNADLAFLEGMFLPEHAHHARAKGHMTVEEAASIARRAQALRAVLVHVSPRYDEGGLQELERAARKEWDRVEVGREGGVYQVPAPESSRIR